MKGLIVVDGEICAARMEHPNTIYFSTISQPEKWEDREYYSGIQWAKPDSVEGEKAMKLFMYAIVSHSGNSGRADRDLGTYYPPTIHVQPTAILAENENQARLMIGKAHPEINFAEVDVYVRTF